MGAFGGKAYFDIMGGKQGAGAEDYPGRGRVGTMVGLKLS